MRLDHGLGHLTYCTNIHAGERWDDVLSSLKTHVPAIKQSVATDEPMGIGLRLSAEAAESLKDEALFADFEAFLEENNYYIFTLNGFPYGTFHGETVKEGAYRPDWRTPERLSYTNLLADHLARWLPEGMEGSISTVPGSFKPWITELHQIEAMVTNMVRHVAHLVEIEQKSGKRINLALEPEPFCFIETIEETIAFFEDHLFGANAVSQLSAHTGLSAPDALRALKAHLGVCYDVCHAAVEFEDPAQSLSAILDRGIKISKLQLSSAIRIPVVDGDTENLIQPLHEPVYMHQVIERKNGVITRHPDVPVALETLSEAMGAEWRIHFHVPIFLEEMKNLSTTQAFLKDVLAIHAKSPVTEQLEIETYTWDILPDEHRAGGLSAAIARELNWVKDELTQS